MTISTTQSVYQYVGNASTKVFAYPAPLILPADLEVRTQVGGTDKIMVSGTDYSFSGVPDDSGNYPNGGQITMTVAPAAGVKLSIRRLTTPTQLADYAEGDKFPAATHEKALDKITMGWQELAAMISRTVRTPVTEGEIPVLPSIAARAGLFLAFDATGVPIAATPADPTALHRPINPVVTVSEGGTGAPDAATARTNLGVRPGVEVQAFDALLQAMAALTTAADRLAYFTGVDSVSLTPLTAFMRTLLDDADAATARATLGLGGSTNRPFTPPIDITEGGTNANNAGNARANLGLGIGTDVQGFNALLASIAGLGATTQADRSIYTTAANTAALYILTSYARQLLDDPDAPTMRTTLGLRPGVEIMGYDAMLAAVAALNTVANQMMYFTGPDLIGLTTLTPYMRTLLDDPDIASAQATLGITGGVTRPISPVVAVTEGGTGAGDAPGARNNLGLRIGTDVQPFSALLSSMGLTSTGVDLMPYFFGIDQVASTPLTAFARTLLGDSTAADMRATLDAAAVISDLNDVAISGIADDQFLQYNSSTGKWENVTISIGAGNLDNLGDVTITGVTDTQILQYNSSLAQWVNVTPTLVGPFQPLDATLTALGGLTTSADKLPYFTGADVAAVTTLTAFARTLLDDVDAVTMLATLGAQPAGSYQAADATLTALAGLATGADRLPYSTGTDVFAQATFTAFARTLVDDIDAATARATLGLTIGSNVQAFDAELNAIAGLTSAADQLPYFTGSGTAALVTLSSVARTLISQTTQALMRTTGLGSTTIGDALFIAASAAAARTTLGLVIGTDVQAQDAELAAIAGLVSAADNAPYFTGSGTAALMSVTSFARTLLDDTTQAAMRTTLALTPGTDVQAFDANTAKLNVAQSWTKPQRYPWTALTDAATIAWDLDVAQNATVSIGANRTMGAPTNIRDGQTVMLKVARTGAFSITSWNAAFDFGTNGVPTQSIVSGKFDVFSFVCVGTTKLNFTGFTPGCSQ